MIYLPKFESFGWGELISLIAVAISFATICVSLFGKSKNETRNEQKLIDRLDVLNGTTHETRDDVKALSSKIDDYGNRITKLEGDAQTLYRRIDRIERTCDAHLSRSRIGGTD